MHKVYNVLIENSKRFHPIHPEGYYKNTIMKNFNKNITWTLKLLKINTEMHCLFLDPGNKVIDMFDI